MKKRKNRVVSRVIILGRVVIGIITGVLMLLWGIKTTIVNNDPQMVVNQCIICGGGLLYSEARWIVEFLRKNPNKHWRQIPRLIKGENVLNIYALNFYKWFLLMAFIVICVQ